MSDEPKGSVCGRLLIYTFCKDGLPGSISSLHSCQVQVFTLIETSLVLFFPCWHVIWIMMITLHLLLLVSKAVPNQFLFRYNTMYMSLERYWWRELRKRVQDGFLGIKVVPGSLKLDMPIMFSRIRITDWLKSAKCYYKWGLQFQKYSAQGSTL